MSPSAGNRGRTIGALKIIFVAVLMLLLGLIAFVTAARQGLLTPDEAALRERYALPSSRFVELDGQVIHYADEGSGPAVVLIHGSFGNLRNWNDWSRILTPDHRVVRFDLPRLGLSGPSPTGRYGVTEEMQLLGALAQALELDEFFLVATSSSGEAAAAYAARYPGQVSGLILANIAVGPLGIDPSHFSPLFRLLIRIDPLFKGWHPRLFWREIMRNNFARPERVTAVQVAEWTDLNNRAQRLPPPVRQPDDPVRFARTPADLARVQSPTLLLWSAEDAELPVETVGRAALEMLGVADKRLVTVPDCGHMMPLECGPESARLARAFFSRLTRGGAGP